MGWMPVRCISSGVAVLRWMNSNATSYGTKWKIACDVGTSAACAFVRAYPCACVFSDQLSSLSMRMCLCVYRLEELDQRSGERHHMPAAAASPPSRSALRTVAQVPVQPMQSMHSVQPMQPMQPMQQPFGPSTVHPTHPGGAVPGGASYLHPHVHAHLNVHVQPHPYPQFATHGGYPLPVPAAAPIPPASWPAQVTALGAAGPAPTAPAWASDRHGPSPPRAPVPDASDRGSKDRRKGAASSAAATVAAKPTSEMTEVIPVLGRKSNRVFIKNAIQCAQHRTSVKRSKFCWICR